MPACLRCSRHEHRPKLLMLCLRRLLGCPPSCLSLAPPRLKSLRHMALHCIRCAGCMAVHQY